MRQNIFVYLHMKASDYYALHNLPYHNLKHVTLVHSKMKEFGEVEDALALAAIWHDAVYIPGVSFGGNEDCSAGALQYAYKCRVARMDPADRYADEDYEILRAMGLILNTKIEQHLCSDIMHDKEQALLNDCDLNAFALPYEQFVEKQKDIIEENVGHFETHAPISAEFLSQFLTCRKYIYHTPAIRDVWEDIAKANIKKYVADYAY